MTSALVIHPYLTNRPLFGLCCIRIQDFVWLVPLYPSIIAVIPGYWWKFCSKKLAEGGRARWYEELIPAFSIFKVRRATQVEHRKQGIKRSVKYFITKIDEIELSRNSYQIGQLLISTPNMHQAGSFQDENIKVIGTTECFIIRPGSDCVFTSTHVDNYNCFQI